MLVRIAVIEFKEAVDEYKLSKVLDETFGKDNVKIHKCCEDATVHWK